MLRELFRLIIVQCKIAPVRDCLRTQPLWGLAAVYRVHSGRQERVVLVLVALLELPAGALVALDALDAAPLAELTDALVFEVKLVLEAVELELPEI